MSRSTSVSTLAGKKYRNGRQLSLDAASFSAAASGGPRYRIYFAQILICGLLTIYIFLPSHLVRHIGTKAMKFTGAPHARNSESKNYSGNIPSIQEEPKPKKKLPTEAGVSIVAACKNRQDTLRSVLPEWRKVENVREIVIVDWSSEPSLKPIIDDQKDPRVKLLRVLGENSWVLSRAYNLAINNTNYDYIIRTDCDYSLKPDILAAHDLEKTSKGFYTGNWNLARDENEVHLNGAMIFNKKSFEGVGGYDERIQTYGWDDEDLYNRLASRNFDKLNISYDHVSHVSHGDKKRAQKGVKFTQVQIDLNQLLLERLPEWSKKNADLSHSTYTVVNGKNSYHELRANFIPKSLQQMAKPEHLDESFSLALGRRLADDFRIPWDVLEGLDTKNRELLLRQLMELQQNLDMVNSNPEITDDTKEFLDSINLETPPKKARVLLIHAQHGLGNRMRAIASALSFASSTARVPVLIWESDAHLAAQYNALYDTSNLPVVTEFKPKWPFTGLSKWDASWDEFQFYNYMEMEEDAQKGELIENDADKHMYYKGAYIMEAPRHTSWDIDNENLRALKPVTAISEKLQEIEDQGLTAAIGVHIRNRTLAQDIKNVNFNDEYGESASAEMQHWREQSSFGNFVIEMNRIISEEDPEAKFYVATDTKEVLDEIQEKFPGRILFVPRTCDDRDSECVQYAMIDVYALSKTKRLLGSNWSSYTELAERLGGLKAELAGQDFGIETIAKEKETSSEENQVPENKPENQPESMS